MDSELYVLSQQVGAALRAAGCRLSCAESCTGGWVAKCITDVAGSSDWFERGFVTYTNDAKREMLGVAATTLETHGAVSEATVIEMARGALDHSHAELAVAISGIAGPGGERPGKPVGTVCFCWTRQGRAPRYLTEHFSGDREAVRQQAVVRALQGVLECV